MDAYKRWLSTFQQSCKIKDIIGFSILISIFKKGNVVIFTLLGLFLVPLAILHTYPPLVTKKMLLKIYRKRYISFT